VRSRAPKEPRVNIAQVLVRIFILIDCIIDTLAVQKIIVYLHVLIPWRHALSSIATRGTSPAIIGNIPNRISASVMLSEIGRLSRKSIARAALHV
jgi:hypothetical protein